MNKKEVEKDYEFLKTIYAYQSGIIDNYQKAFLYMIYRANKAINDCAEEIKNTKDKTQKALLVENMNSYIGFRDELEKQFDICQHGYSSKAFKWDYSSMKGFSGFGSL